MTTDAQAALASANSALKVVADAVAEKDASLSKLSLQVDSLSAANVGLQAQLDTANATIASQTKTIADLKAQIPVPPPPVPKTVKDFWGAADVVWNNAFRRMLAAGVKTVPAGEYLMDALDPVIVTSGQSLEMDPNAILRCKPNAAARYYVLRAQGDNISIKGGQIIGDRLKHTYTAGSTHEWGYGFYGSGSGTVDGLKVSECTGDGIGVSGKWVIRNTVSTKNRRQGLSAFSCDDLKIYDSEFSQTGALLTDGAAPNGPCAGIDVEPDRGSVVNVYLERVKMTGNRAGFLAWLRSEVGGTLNCTLVDCDMAGNSNGAHAKALAGAINVNIKGGKVTNNSGSGFRIESGATFTVNDVLFDRSGDRADFTLTGMDSRTRYDINLVSSTTGAGKAIVGTNRYV